VDLLDQAVEHADAVARRQEVAREVGADEARAPGYQHVERHRKS
jgi:hypothetical protein